jgi:hypothetical protein
MTKTIQRLLVAITVSIWCIWSVATAQQDSARLTRDSLFEDSIASHLTQINPAAVPLFREATEARDAGNLEQAKEGFNEVLRLAPGFSDAERRLCWIELELGDVSAGLLHAGRALAADSGAYNRIALAYALILSGDSTRFAEALRQSQLAANELPNDALAQQVLLMAGVSVRSEFVVRDASEKLVRLAPESPEGHYYYGLSLAWLEQWESSEQELLKAQNLGAKPEAVEELLAQGIRTNAQIDRWKRRGLISLVTWASILGLLFLASAWLSQLTLKTVERAQSTGNLQVSKQESAVRTVYRSVIAATSVYFYVSIPVLMAVVLISAGAFAYFWLSVGRMPVNLVLIVVAGTIVTLYALVSSLFVRSKDLDPGRKLTREQAPGLWDVTEEVATTVQTRPIQAIFVTLGTEVAVMERGGMWKKLRGQGERCLILGIGAIPGLKVSSFKSVLAHEYGHFSNRDTAGGNLAQQTNRSMQEMALTLAKNGFARWYNPAWWFLRGYSAVFWRVTLGASRLQEILADRIGAAAYGTKSFVAGLTHLIKRDLAFRIHLENAVDHDVEGLLNTKNLYTLDLSESSEQTEEFAAELSQIMTRQSATYDSHPAPIERFAFLEKLNVREPSDDGTGDVSQLFPNAEELQIEMTVAIHSKIKARLASGTISPTSSGNSDNHSSDSPVAPGVVEEDRLEKIKIVCTHCKTELVVNRHGSAEFRCPCCHEKLQV